MTQYNWNNFTLSQWDDFDLGEWNIFLLDGAAASPSGEVIEVAGVINGAWSTTCDLFIDVDFAGIIAGVSTITGRPGVSTPFASSTIFSQRKSYAAC